MQQLHSSLPKRLSTHRLVLRPVAMSDVDIIFQEFTPEITRYMYPVSPKKIEETISVITSFQVNMKEGKEFVAAITEKRTGEFYGMCGIHKFQTLMPELGIWLKKSAHGNAYGLESICALYEWLKEHKEYKYVLYSVAKENYASRRIPEKLGGSVAREYFCTKKDATSIELLEYRLR
jgi:RimJ/RimL family protein N-acetyltransferase